MKLDAWKQCLLNKVHIKCHNERIRSERISRLKGLSVSPILTCQQLKTPIAVCSCCYIFKNLNFKYLNLLWRERETWDELHVASTLGVLKRNLHPLSEVWWEAINCTCTPFPPTKLGRGRKGSHSHAGVPGPPWVKKLRPKEKEACNRIILSQCQWGRGTASVFRLSSSF